MEKNVSLTYDEAAALLEMSMLTYANTDENAASSALIKLGALCREFAEEANSAGEPLVKAA
ncbi:MAG: hypothetical protein JW941_09380 [Candidatus Coatesbacteria bacterium]|nr:hypothetical protein [Candidatus Coatesbacteria bacterium]